jgi:membrane protein DedA with SNARE-associated domain
LATIIDTFIDSILGLAKGDPLLGVFLASLAGNMIPFFPVPYLFVVVFVATTSGGLSLIQVATIGALGAAIGKFVIYSVSYGAGTALPGSPARFDVFRERQLHHL